MKFLVTGSTGLVGIQVIKDLVRNEHQTYSAYHNSKPDYGIPIKMDLCDFDSITTVIEQVKPEAIIHLAAMTNVDHCEKEKKLAMRINAEATKIISKSAARYHAFLVYLSTDYVFDGQQGSRKETDPTNPVDFYGKSKLVGEKAVMDSNSSWCITRTSTPFGLHTKKSFPLWVTENLQANHEINVVTDQYTSPTYVPNLSRMLIEIAIRQITGTLHIAGATRISRYEVANLVANEMNLDTRLLKPASIDSMSWIAKRPKDSSLDVSKANSILQEKPLTIQEGIEHFVRQMEP